MVAWNAYNTVACWQLTEDDVSPIFTPLYHAGGLGAFLTGTYWLYVSLHVFGKAPLPLALLLWRVSNMQKLMQQPRIEVQ